ncbi:MAG: hypothetical protein L0Z62_21910 [Gemmataceae bacterium]|nr:hypothetical protein [Gemmataceae bacterium]
MFPVVPHLPGKAMTDTEWNASTDPVEMFAAVCESASWWAGLLSRGRKAARASLHRKCRLFTVACCRRHVEWREDASPAEYRDAIRISERYADGLATEAELRRAHNAAHGWTYMVREAKTWWGQRLLGWLPGDDDPPLPSEVAVVASAHWDAMWAGRVVIRTALDYPESFWRGQATTAEESADILCGLLREVFGPSPFRPVTLEPSWRTPAVVALARSMYEESGWVDLPILADALEEAGCTDPAILDHLRGPGPHVRGCWAVDLFIGSE